MNERPNGMDFEKYKSIQKEENKNLNSYLKYGKVVYMAWEIFTNHIFNATNIRRYSPAKRVEVNG